MTSSQFLELFASVSLQAAVLAWVTHALCRRVRSGAMQSRLWLTYSIAQLGLTIAGLLLPHPRHFAPWSTISDQSVLEVAQYEERLGMIVLWVWAAGAIVASVFLASGLNRTNEFLGRCELVNPQRFSLDRVLPTLARKLPGGHSIQVLSDPSISSPICWQFHRPYVVLPAALLSLDDEQLRLILRHELEHLRTGHPLQLLIQKVVQAIFWFHPSVWWASRQAMLAREFACDDAAIESPAEIAAYLKALLAVVELGVQEQDRGGWSLGISRQQSTLAIRSRRLVALASRDGGQGVSIGWRRIMLVSATLLLAAVWLPVDVLASSRSRWSPWPGWSAKALHLVGVRLRDFEPYDRRTQTHELREPRR